MRRATAVAHPNIALVKYWGKRDLARNPRRHALVGEVDRDLMLRRQLAPQAVDGGYQTDQLEFWRM